MILSCRSSIVFENICLDVSSMLPRLSIQRSAIFSRLPSIRSEKLSLKAFSPMSEIESSQASYCLSTNLTDASYVSLD